MLTTNQKGNIAEAEIAAAAIRLGIPVLRPVAEHSRYDLVFELGGRFVRVQCKWATRRGDVIAVGFRTNRRGPNGFIRTTYTPDEVDAIAAYCPDTDQCYYLPMEKFGGRTAVQLRLTAPKNGQRASIHFEAEHRFGAVAQLAERRLGKAEVGGSSPLSSTPEPPPTEIEVGAHEFRNLFGYFMQRAAAGEEILVRRRGKPLVRLTAVSPQLLAQNPAPVGLPPAAAA